MTLTVDSKVILLSPGVPGRSEIRAFRVQVRKSVILPARSEAMVTCRPLGDTFAASGMVEAREGPPPGVMVARTLVDASKKSFQVLMANLNDKPKRIKACTVVGTCEKVEVSEPIEAQADVEYPHMPSHLRDLSERCCAQLSAEQRKSAECLLQDYADIFSHGDHDLGCTHLAEHHINTGSHDPVKTPSRRLPMAKRAEAEKLITGMAEQGFIERCASPWSSALVLVKKGMAPCVVVLITGLSTD